MTRGIHADCLLNYETVKYFGGEEHEGARYNDAIREYQVLEAKVIGRFHLFDRALHYSTLNASSFTEPPEPGSKFHHSEFTYCRPWMKLTRY